MAYALEHILEHSTLPTIDVQQKINSVKVKQMFFQFFLLTKNKINKKYWNLLGRKP
jgi:hypothetical protein